MSLTNAEKQARWRERHLGIDRLHISPIDAQTKGALEQLRQKWGFDSINEVITKLAFDAAGHPEKARRVQSGFDF
jgi:hypothetical protein